MEMFHDLYKWNTILVTGPHRAGGTICAKMIAQDTRRDILEDTDIQLDFGKAFAAIEKGDIVIQCPQLFRFVHEFVQPWVLVVVMRRDIADIDASTARIGADDTPERAKYSGLDYDRLRTAYDLPHIGESLPLVQYTFWDRVQRHWVKNYMEVNYEDLSEHELWVPKEDRLDFHPKQTEVEDDS